MSDERLLADLGRALPPDPAPPGLADRADALFAVRDLDGGLAELLEPEAAEPAGVRGGDIGTDQLTFELGAVTVELTVGPNRIAGRVLGAGPWTVTLEHPTGTPASTPAGDLGEFAF
ncbi:hypothetical protein, partial [Virgisporangium aurantiacum]|uniref:hypothetical protein n=1 Tax=Virgisporangium aurantiacum TaxID=175570 RepID=UPI00194F136A